MKNTVILTLDRFSLESSFIIRGLRTMRLTSEAHQRELGIQEFLQLANKPLPVYRLLLWVNFQASTALPLYRLLLCRIFQNVSVLGSQPTLSFLEVVFQASTTVQASIVQDIPEWLNTRQSTNSFFSRGGQPIYSTNIMLCPQSLGPLCFACRDLLCGQQDFKDENLWLNKLVRIQNYSH